MKYFFAALLLSLCISPAIAEQGLTVKQAWIREAPPGAAMMAAYLTIDNTSARDQALLSVSSPRFAHITLHRSLNVDGVARMRSLERIALPAHSSVTLEPGGYHLMMSMPDKRLASGERVPLVLHLADHSEIRVTAQVRKKP